ncbi:hypothetical protein [Chromobacterium haemolyticum]|uniref:hypothetical protein n=1 Tax=Chromobacterium haemolyticum TaxID=394935 RepID=UPI00244A6762|nr:hypothetical protein [Chromobacterium haemolyticum]MDH0342111.1 hypothetical protein [Chromobacterium haemolyticum]
MSAHYYDWKSISAERAQRVLDQGGTLFKLPTTFGNGMAVFSHGLKTKRGACYVVSDRILRGLNLPAKH